MLHTILESFAWAGYFGGGCLVVCASLGEISDFIRMTSLWLLRGNTR